MPKKEQGWITFQTSEDERKLLEEFCQQSHRTKTEVLRELIRNFTKYSSPSPQPIPTNHKQAKNTHTSQTEVITSKRPLKVSFRNILKGIVTKVVKGEISSQRVLSKF